MTAPSTTRPTEPYWLRVMRIPPDVHESCTVCGKPAVYGAVVDDPMCRAHTLAGVCYTCGSPVTCFGRDPGDYVCEHDARHQIEEG